jgi:hypothetical protein
VCDETRRQRRVIVFASELRVPHCNSVYPSLEVLGGGAELEQVPALPHKREGIDFRSVSRRFCRFAHARLVVVAARFHYYIVHKNACLHDVRHLVALGQATRLLENVPTSDKSCERSLNILLYDFLSACITLVLRRHGVVNRLDEESPSRVQPVGEEVRGLERDVVDKRVMLAKLTAKYSLHRRAHIENVQVVETARVAPNPALPVHDSFEEDRRLLLPALEQPGKLDPTDLPGPLLALDGTDVAWNAAVGIYLENAAQVIFGWLASILDAVQLANYAAKHGQRLMSRQVADSHVFIDRIGCDAIRKLAQACHHTLQEM